MGEVYQDGVVRVPYGLDTFYKDGIKYVKVTVDPKKATVSNQTPRRFISMSRITIERKVGDMSQGELEGKIGKAFKSLLKV